jgi:hypothetical protein
MLHFETVDLNTLELLKRIQNHSIFSGTRLVGGTALALQIGHRKSIDLDFFGRMDITPIELRQTLDAYGEVSLRNASGRIQRFMVCGVQVDFVDYDYPWLDEAVSFDGLRLASCSDIAAMKLSAITNRGTKKDFIDLAFLLERFSLSEMLDFYKRKFSDGASFPVLKSLVFFDDAEADPMPNMLHVVDWDSAKQRISEAVADLSAVTW